MSNLTINAEAKVRRLCFEELGSGDRRIDAQVYLFPTGSETSVVDYSVTCVQPKSDTKAAENYLESFLLEQGIYS